MGVQLEYKRNARHGVRDYRTSAMAIGPSLVGESENLQIARERKQLVTVDQWLHVSSFVWLHGILVDNNFNLPSRIY